MVDDIVSLLCFILDVPHNYTDASTHKGLLLLQEAYEVINLHRVLVLSVKHTSTQMTEIHWPVESRRDGEDKRQILKELIFTSTHIACAHWALSVYCTCSVTALQLLAIYSQCCGGCDNTPTNQWHVCALIILRDYPITPGGTLYRKKGRILAYSVHDLLIDSISVKSIERFWHSKQSFFVEMYNYGHNQTCNYAVDMYTG